MEIHLTVLGSVMPKNNQTTIEHHQKQGWNSPKHQAETGSYPLNEGDSCFMTMVCLWTDCPGIPPELGMNHGHYPGD
jgi:hypothetical protein